MTQTRTCEACERPTAVPQRVRFDRPTPSPVFLTCSRCTGDAVRNGARIVGPES